MNGIYCVVAIVSIVELSKAAFNVIPQARPASYPEKPNTLVTNNWFDCDKYDFAMYGNSYFGAPLSFTLVAFKPPKKDWNSVKTVFTDMGFQSIVKDGSWEKFVAPFESLWG